MIRAAIAGCGKIADQHVLQIQRISDCQIVALCDREELMARQLAERIDVEHCFTDLAQLISTTRPDVVHITTPPPSHFELASLCLQKGCHVYVEKPFTLNAREAEELIALASRQKLKLTAGHNLQFTHDWIQMRKLVRDGFLGGKPIHLESYYTYNLKDRSYAKALLGDASHWVRQLPGKLLHNIISHGIARIAEFLETDDPKVVAVASASPMIQQMGESDIFDELRVIISGDTTTAYFTFSSQIGPPLNQFRLLGPANSLLVDNFHRTLTRYRNRNYKSYLNYFVPPLILARENWLSSVRNVKKFIARDFHDDSGMKALIENFYRSVGENIEPPIPYREILLTARLMDSIFEQLSERNSSKKVQTLAAVTSK